MRALPRAVFALGAVSLFMDIASEMVYPLLPLFLSGVLGASPALIGLIEGVAEATASLTKVVGGRISDRVGRRKPLILLGYGLSPLVRPLLALAQIPAHVLAARFVDRVGKGLRTAPRDALIAEVTPEAQYGRAYGLHRGLDTLGATIGPLLAALLLPVLGFRGVFWISIIPALVAVLVIVIWVKETPGRTQGPAAWQWRGYSRNYWFFLAVAGIFTLGLSSNAFLLLRLQELGYSAAQVTLIYAGYNLAYALLAYPLGALGDQIGRQRVVAGGFLIYGLVYLGFGLTDTAIAGLLLMLLYAVYSAAFEGSASAYLAELIPAQQKATAIGLYHTLVGLLLFPASAIFGALAGQYGMNLAFMAGAGFALLAFMLFEFFQHMNWLKL